MKRVQIYMDEKQLDELKKKKKKSGVSVSYMIRKCVAKYLKTIK